MSNTISVPLRILMTTDPVAGVWSYTIDLCHTFQKLAAQARGRAKKFNAQTMGQQYGQAYRSLLNAKPQSEEVAFA